MCWVLGVDLPGYLSKLGGFRTVLSTPNFEGMFKVFHLNAPGGEPLCTTEHGHDVVPVFRVRSSILYQVTEGIPTEGSTIGHDHWARTTSTRGRRDLQDSRSRSFLKILFKELRF